jgi:CSLREA domain-containing protein
MESLRDDNGWGAAFNSPADTNPTPPLGENWPGVKSLLGRISEIAVTAGATKPAPALAIGDASGVNYISTLPALRVLEVRNAYPTQAGGLYTPARNTAADGGQTANGLTVTGLAPGTTNYFIVRTFTPAHTGTPGDNLDNLRDNPSDLTSVNSAELAAQAVEAPGLVVTTTSDSSTDTDDQTSLREAIAYANSGNAGANPVITFSNSTANGAVNFHDGTARTISLPTGQLVIGSSVTLTGPGANLLTVRNTAPAGPTSRVFNITAGTVTISGLTISGGNNLYDDATAFTNGGGGGIRNAGTLTVVRCVIAGNTSEYTGTVAGTSAGGAGIFGVGGGAQPDRQHRRGQLSNPRGGRRFVPEWRCRAGLEQHDLWQPVGQSERW